MGKQKCHLLHTEHEKGIALITALLLLVLMSALAVAVVYKVNYEQHLQGTDSGNNVAFYGAEAGMEKMVADLNALYKAQAAPGCNDIAKLYQSAQEPSSSDVGVGYSQYTITLPDGTDLSSCTVPPSRVQAISQGPNAGLQAQVVPLRMSVAALTPAGESVAWCGRLKLPESRFSSSEFFQKATSASFPALTSTSAGAFTLTGTYSWPRVRARPCGSIPLFALPKMWCGINWQMVRTRTRKIEPER